MAPIHGTGHPMEGVRLCPDHVFRRVERRVGAIAARCLGIPDTAGVARQNLFGIWLKQLYDVRLSRGESFDILWHRPSRLAVQRRRVDIRAPQILLQAHPWSRHFRDTGEAHIEQILEVEVGVRRFADQEKGIARYRLRKSENFRFTILVTHDHDAHRPAPINVGDTVAQLFGDRIEARARAQRDIHPFRFIGAE